MPPLKNRIGDKYGRLMVIKRALNKGEHVCWTCQCDCGAIVIVKDSNLRSGNTQSCGCIRMSQSEKTIASILKENYINFSIEYVVNIQGKNCRYDFCIKDKENNPIYFIEADGEHHFYAQDSGTRYTLADFEITQEHDKIKNQWCKDNHFPLIRIPYTHFKDIELKDLLLETSTYLI